MSSPHHRTSFGRALVAGACVTALALGPAAGLASADDDSLAKTFTERAQQVNKREKALSASIKALQKTPSLSRAKSAAKDAGAIYRTTDALRTEIRDDDGSSDKGTEARDAVLPKLTAMAAAAKKLDTQFTTAVKKKKVTKSVVAKIVVSKAALDKSILTVITAISDVLENNTPVDPAPAPVDPTT
ncbi:hypothetical protein AB0L40_24415 [Patulibacter sp. NPDC049589]|uniref:hypothetical protein n=1 Tax=Patulibacter sp. NPDC049589 TaxID=3154731 RepID=UPI00341B6618